MQIIIDDLRNDLLKIRHDMAKKGRLIMWAQVKNLTSGSAGKMFRRTIKELILYYWEHEAKR